MDAVGKISKEKKVDSSLWLSPLLLGPIVAVGVFPCIPFQSPNAFSDSSLQRLQWIPPRKIQYQLTTKLQTMNQEMDWSGSVPE